MLPAIAAFAAGALCGAFGIAHLAFGCVVLPLGILMALVVGNVAVTIAMALHLLTQKG